MNDHEPFSFDSLNLQVGDDVLVSNDHTLSDMVYAKVIAVKRGTQAIDAIAHSLGGKMFRQCWHRDDPRIITHRNRFVNQGSGVFVLTDGEIARKGIARRIDVLERRMETMDSALTRLTCGSLSEPSEDAKDADASEALPCEYEDENVLIPKRPRGRPRKVLTE